MEAKNSISPRISPFDTKKTSIVEDYYKFYDNIILKVVKTNDVITSTALFSKDDEGNVTHFRYVTNQFHIDRLTMSFLQLSQNSSCFDEDELLSRLKWDSVCVDNIIVFDHSSHTIFNVKQIPISCVFTNNEIGLPQELHRNCEIFEDLFQAYRKSKYVIVANKGSIPYYNAEFTDQQGIVELRVSIPDNLLKELWVKLIKNVDPYPPTIRLKDYCLGILNLPENLKEFDFIGIADKLTVYNVKKYN